MLSCLLVLLCLCAFKAKLAIAAEECADRLPEDQQAWDFVSSFHGLEIIIEVGDPYKHVEFAIQTVVLEKTVGKKNGVVMTKPETWVLPGIKSDTVVAPCSMKWFKDANKGRNEFNKKLNKAKKDNGLEIIAWAQLRTSKFVAEDRNWMITERILYQLCYTQCTKVLEEAAIELLPASGQWKSIQSVIDATTKLKDGSLFRFVPPKQSGPVLSAMSLVKDLRKGTITSQLMSTYVGAHFLL